jgi:hypothetical protein
VVGWLARIVGTSQLDTNCSQPTKVVTLACEFKAGKALWIANISRETCAVQVSGLPKKLLMQRINTRTFNSLSKSTVLAKPMPTAKPFDLRPYELVLVTTQNA